jgi:Co/Zn/Cd efflux system component
LKGFRRWTIHIAAVAAYAHSEHPKHRQAASKRDASPSGVVCLNQIVPNQASPRALSAMVSSSASSTHTVVYAALIGNLLIAVTKFGAAWWTGSSVMLSEAIHSLVDTTNQGLLLYGLYRAARPPDEQHPLGHSREIYL